jgi:hypothetical protein
MKKLLSALFALALCSSMALATVPYPPNCVVTPCDALGGAIMCPDNPSPIPTSVVTLTIRNQANNPIANAAVNVTFGTGPLCVCPSMVFNTTTNSSGGATMTLRGGGCINGVTDACVFRANGVVVRTYPNLKSPDWDGAAGNCSVNLSDFVRFAGGTDLCFDFNNVGGIDLSDIVTFISGFTPSHHCP